VDNGQDNIIFIYKATKHYIFWCFVYENDIVLSIVHTLICLVNNSWTYNVPYINNYLFYGDIYIYILLLCIWKWYCPVHCPHFYVHELLTKQINVWTMDRTISFSYTKQQNIYIYITIEQIHCPHIDLFS
jgi:hypothetical protein